MVGEIARNNKGRLGIVLGHHYDHKNGGRPFRFYGIGIRGGNWTSQERPTFIASNIEDYARKHKEIQEEHRRSLHGD